MPISEFERSIQDVVETLRNARGRGRGCSLLIGAGCSATADIPLAGGIVQEFAKQYPRRYDRVAVRTYPHCMAELAHNERSDLISPYIDKAKINWAHVAIAQLTKAGYVTRILTTNFDPLIVKACATVGVFPAVYDLAASHEFRADRVYEPSVFYLHGQRAGFVTLHTDDEVQRHKETLRPVFDDAGKGRIWIVCGYSGDNDPVFEHLANVPTFGCNLYWVGYNDATPSEHVRERLLVKDKFAFHVSGHDADSFFVELARQLDCFPPTIIAKPFSHLLEVTDSLSPYTIGSESADLRQVARTRIQAAIDQFEQGEKASDKTKALAPDALDATSLLFSGKYDEVLALYEATTSPTEELLDAASWALIRQGDELKERARSDPGAADELWRATHEKYISALHIKPDKHEALNNWGIALAAQARTKSGAEADGLWAAAYEKYEAALQIKPDKHEALNNWGIALAAQARTKSGAEADRLWAAAYEKYEAALRLKPDKHEALYNWGIALDDQAKTKSGAEADELWAAAYEKYEAALQIKPDKHEALYNWGIALDAQARTKSGAEADGLWAAAYEKYEAALQIKPDKHEALNNWGIALAAQARTKSRAEADRLWAAAYEKYEAALRIKPDKHEALRNWASGLLTQAAAAAPEAREDLLRAAVEKCERANNIVPGQGSYNLACAFGIRGDAESCRKWLLHSKEHGKLPDRDYLLNDPDLASVRDQPWFAELIA